MGGSGGGLNGGGSGTGRGLGGSGGGLNGGAGSGAINTSAINTSATSSGSGSSGSGMAGGARGNQNKNKRGQIHAVTTKIEAEPNRRALLGKLPPAVPGVIGAWVREDQGRT
ncbi:hypothetical protein CPHO_09350 [Corynebacterium phocae]|uniref:Uncharacterized protein n=2 Tax=Corynebacterium phocae TaxID=161895 RepID=A0A1L7D4L1_9CORY|nr:hypothetical protein CPHO_09350 [Corynebacterium phocae]